MPAKKRKRISAKPSFIGSAAATPQSDKAVIYARVSSAQQRREGHGIESQIHRGLEYARYKNLAVVETFRDDFTGSVVRRPGMDAMLAFLRQHRKERISVIIDDISRLARDLEAHIQLRAAITSAGGILISPAIEFGKDPDSKLVEHIQASVSQHMREKNAQTTANRMLARVTAGYWCFPAPAGYRFEKVDGHGKLMVRDEPCASIVKEAYEGFASGRFQTQAAVQIGRMNAART